jgi:pimeloyl-ACP methyl ester carboxylesterase
METTVLSASQANTTMILENAYISTKRRKNYVLTIISFLILLTVGAVLTFHGYIAWSLARPYIAPLSSNPMKAVGLGYEEVRFTSSSGGSMLEGWYIPSRNSDKTVIFSHGYGGNREELWVPFYSLAKELHKHQYNVLLFDYSYVIPDILPTGGIRESLELQGAIDYVKQRGSAHTYIWGFSMGAGTALQTALHTQDIAGMVLDSTFLLEPETMFLNVRQHLDLPRLSLPLIRLFFPLLNGTSLNQIPYQTIKQTTYSMPILFIHSMKDAKAPFGIVQSIYDNQASTQLAKLWLLPEGRHELIYKANKKEYLKRALSFFDLARVDIP